jgi:glycosyl hydrolase family 99
MFNRRQFLASLAVPLALGQSSTRGRPADSAPAGLAVPRNPDGYPPLPTIDVAAIGRQLRRQFSDLRNHFIFEYYPWYGTNPWRHWESSGRMPPYDIAATSVPELGPYDSGNPRVLEQHARWIAESGAGAINVSWWGRGDYEDQRVPLLMDVMRDYGLKVTFHLEPYSSDRVDSYASDIQYLVTEYGDKRHWDCQLVLRSADGTEGPVFKAFATIQPRFLTDCHGRTAPVAIWRPDDVWHRQTDTVRETLRRRFDNVWLLSDFPVPDPVLATGFDGAAPYGAFTPQDWPQLARAFSGINLTFSPSIGTGFDAIVERNVPSDSCYRPPTFVPPAIIDWTSASDREKAARLALWQIEASMRTSLEVQTDSTLRNSSTGFFIVYIATFNEWHEGTAFEPMKDRAALLPQELPFGYHNPADGRYRLDYLKPRLEQIIRG